MQDEEPDVAPRVVTRGDQLARRVGALLFVAVFLVDVFGDPTLLLALREMCGL